MASEEHRETAVAAAPSGVVEISEKVKKRGEKLSNQNPYFIGLIMLLLATMPPVMTFKVPTILMNLMDIFSMNATVASWLMTIITIVGIVLAIPSGIFTQKFGPKVALFVASCLIVLGSILGAFAGVSWVLIASRAIEGMGIIIVTIASPILIERCVKPERRGTAMGIYGVFGSAGVVVGSVVTPTVFEVMGFRGLWLVYAAAMAIVCAIMFIAIKMPPSAYLEYLSQMARAKGEAPAVVEKPRFRELMTKDIWCLFGGFIALNVALIAISSYVPTILQVQGYSATLSGVVSSLPMAISLITSPVAGVLSDKIGRIKPFLVISIVCVAPTVFLMFITTGITLWLAAIVMGIIGFCAFGLYLAAYMAILPRPELASIGMGVFGMVQGLGQFGGTFFVQLLLGPTLSRVYIAATVIALVELFGGFLLSRINIR